MVRAAIHPSLVERSLDTTASKVESVLSKPVRTLHEFASLISPAAESRLEELSRHAHALTVQRFGKVIPSFSISSMKS